MRTALLHHWEHLIVHLSGAPKYLRCRMSLQDEDEDDDDDDDDDHDDQWWSMMINDDHDDHDDDYGHDWNRCTLFPNTPIPDHKNPCSFGQGSLPPNALRVGGELSGFSLANHVADWQHGDDAGRAQFGAENSQVITDMRWEKHGKLCIIVFCQMLIGGYPLDSCFLGGFGKIFCKQICTRVLFLHMIL